jgi:hypothetical protein
VDRDRFRNVAGAIHHRHGDDGVERSSVIREPTKQFACGAIEARAYWLARQLEGQRTLQQLERVSEVFGTSDVIGRVDMKCIMPDLTAVPVS